MATKRLQHWLAKLTPQQVRHIRTSYPKLTQTQLAAHYGVSQATISNVLRKRTYRAIQTA